MGLMLQSLQQLRTRESALCGHALVPAPHGRFRFAPISDAKPAEDAVPVARPTPVDDATSVDYSPLRILPNKTLLAAESLVTICAPHDPLQEHAVAARATLFAQSQFALGPDVRQEDVEVEVADFGNFDAWIESASHTGITLTTDEPSHSIDEPSRSFDEPPRSAEAVSDEESSANVSDEPIKTPTTGQLRLRADYQDLAAQLQSLLPIDKAAALLLAWPMHADENCGDYLLPLSLQLAQVYGQRMLVIDATTNQDIIGSLGLSHLSGLLDMSHDLSQNSESIIHRLDSLSLLGRGGLDNAAIDPIRLRTALQVLQRQYPSLMLFANAADPLTAQLSTMTSDTLLCIRLAATSHEELIAARDQLVSQQGRVTGCLAFC